MLPALLMLAGCATTGGDYSASNAAAPAMAPPQRVDAVSDALGAKMDNMLASRPFTSNSMTR
ncbi:MAG TPA: hypothetical protein VND19_05735 [Acetobacteraceae bacterium]|nr:hypothetical protein [Acetobacteraceae bacterium]